MTINGAIMELVMLRENPDMPYYLKPSLDKVIETISEAELVEPKDEPQKDCKKCKNYDRCKNNRWKCCVYQPKDEQSGTDCAWK